MYAGFIVEEANVDDLYENPQHPYTRSLLKSLPRLDGSRDEKLMTIEGLPPDLIKLPTGCPFGARCYLAKEKCFSENPPLIQNGNRRVSCWVNVETGEYR
ncbi:MAG: hypothetical protein OEY93_09235 [Anaerolineae bacterium]|nr:hypothetical protein [Anaerolineae bacterium]